MVGKRFRASDLLGYVVAQVLGGACGAGVLYVIASGKPSFDLAGGFASNGYGLHSPGGYSLVSCLVAPIVGAAIAGLVYPMIAGEAEPAQSRSATV
jgi:aquaporin Z